jgi:hypothetical protein
MTTFINTYYTIRANDWKGTSFSIKLNDITEFYTIDITNYENLTKKVRKIWQSKVCNIDGISITPLEDFEVISDDITYKFYLGIDKKQRRSKKVDIELRVGGKYNNTNIINWQESIVEEEAE